MICLSYVFWQASGATTEVIKTLTQNFEQVLSTSSNVSDNAAGLQKTANTSSLSSTVVSSSSVGGKGIAGMTTEISKDYVQSGPGLVESTAAASAAESVKKEEGSSEIKQESIKNALREIISEIDKVVDAETDFSVHPKPTEVPSSAPGKVEQSAPAQSEITNGFGAPHDSQENKENLGGNTSAGQFDIMDTQKQVNLIFSLYLFLICLRN